MTWGGKGGVLWLSVVWCGGVLYVWCCLMSFRFGVELCFWVWEVVCYVVLSLDLWWVVISGIGLAVGVVFGVGVVCCFWFLGFSCEW